MFAGHLLGRFRQRGYYDRIIRNEDELQAIREYIANNPVRWATEGARPRPPDRRL